jgi:hypothetical protein
MSTETGLDAEGLDAYRREVSRLRAERDALKAAMRHHAAEAHRRKWAHQNTSPATFDELHRLGNELSAALAALESHEDAPGDADEGDQWRRDEREISGGFSGCEFPRLWPPRQNPPLGDPEDTREETGRG